MGLPMLELIKQLLTFMHLVRRFGLRLLLIAVSALLLHDLVLTTAVRIGFVSQVAGLILLAPAVLIDLIGLMLMLHCIRPGMPAFVKLQQRSAGIRQQQDNSYPGLAGLSIALLPFFAYYAAWGFLGNIIRDYSLLALKLDPFGQHGKVLDVRGGWWMAATVGVVWVIRSSAKIGQRYRPNKIWSFIMVLCEASWIFLGIYVLSRWQSELMEWVVARTPSQILHDAFELLMLFISPAHAANVAPLDDVELDIFAILQGLFFYTLLPLVWFAMAAIVYGYDIDAAQEAAWRDRRIGRALEGYQKMPAFLRDFVGHFLNGYLKRYRSILNGARIAASTSLVLVLVMVLGYRFIDWISAWAWVALVQLVGPKDLIEWQIIAKGVTILIGSPSASGTGVVPLAFKICLIGATFERACVSRLSPS
jgi:hypothetical protein